MNECLSEYHPGMHLKYSHVPHRQDNPPLVYFTHFIAPRPLSDTLSLHAPSVIDPYPIYRLTIGTRLNVSISPSLPSRVKDSLFGLRIR